MAKDSPKGDNRPARRAVDLRGEAGFGQWLALGLVVLFGLTIWVAGVIISGAYLAPVFGKGWPWFLATLAVALGLPMVAGGWLVRPLSGYKRAVWFVGVCLVVPLLPVIGLSVGARKHTAVQLRKAGFWPFEMTFGKTENSKVSQVGALAVLGWADALHGGAHTIVDKAWAKALAAARRTARKGPAGRRTRLRTRPRTRPRARPKKSIFFLGKKQSSKPRPAAKNSKTVGRASRLRFARKGGAMLVEARLTQGRKRLKAGFIVDTGATLSTITRDSAEKLGIKVSPNPMQVELQTAGGLRSFPIVVLDRLRLGKRAQLRRVTVAICDACSPRGLSGSVGLNFTSHFLITIDPRKRRLELRRLAGKPNRLADIEPFLQLLNVKGVAQGKSFLVSGKVGNRSRRKVRDVVLVAALIDSHGKVIRRLKTRVERIGPRANVDFDIGGPASAALVRYQLELHSARW